MLFHHVIHEPEEWERHSAAWLPRRPAEEQALARDLVNHDNPAVATCRRQPDGTWRLLARRQFLMLGSITLHPATDFPEEQQDDAAG